MDFVLVQTVRKYNLDHEKCDLHEYLWVPYSKILHSYLKEADKMILPNNMKLNVKIL